ncbi:MAG: Fe-Mn family superoxide dismutase [Candidatus Pacebacteria bacterium]|nr:Fe-Mn family superoxide dismutase [Candidatus Paceibacterota bacterium]
MHTYLEKKFKIPALAGISSNTITEHLKLYAGYVKHSNLILQKISELSATPEAAEKNVYAIGELRRRFGFEFDGMRNHEYYFAQFEGAPKQADQKSPLSKKIASVWGNFDAWFKEFNTLAMTRGIGWAILYYDPTADTLLNVWADEQHLGHLTGLKPILMLDMWEHSFMLDYPPSEKKKYVEAFFTNLNGEVVEERFAEAVGK